MSSRFRRLALLVLGGCLLALPAAAWASYPGANGGFTWQTFEASGALGGPVTAEVSVIANRSGTLLRCGYHQGGLPLQCDFGGPTFAPDGTTLVVSRQIPLNAFNGIGGTGAVEFVLPGRPAKVVNQQTADDEHPAVMPSGSELIFDGRLAASKARNLYEISMRGTGLRELTRTGGAEPAPCANGTVAFSRGAGIWLLSRSRKARRLTPNGNEPSCAPNSRRVAFERHNGLYTIGVNARGLRLVTRVESYAPQFSPDGTRIAFLHKVRDPSGNGGHIAIDVVSLSGAPHPNEGVPVVAISGSSEALNTSYTGRSAGFAWPPRAR